jgi:hypothetical protein
MVDLLRLLIRVLSDTVAVWGTFEQTEMGYFLHGGEPGSLSALKPSLLAINKTFWELKDLRRKLMDLEKELYQDNPRGVSGSYPKYERRIVSIRLIDTGLINPALCSSGPRK